MDLGDEEFMRTLTEMREKTRRVEARKLLGRARERIGQVGKRLDAVEIAPKGVMAAVDRRFVSTQTFLPSTMVRTQLRLAIHYVQAADAAGFPTRRSQPPTLSSFVVLRTAIECTASAHWLMSAKNQRETIERVLKRMWWDTTSAADMANTADGARDTSSLIELKARISEITRPVKGLDSAKVFESERVKLSRIVANASADLRPSDPTIMHAGWMMCAGIAHGNIPVSAGAGISVASLQQPSQHLIDDTAYALVLSAVIEDILAAVQLFERRAAEQHEEQVS